MMRLKMYKDATVYTNERVLECNGHFSSTSAEVKNSKIIQPCFIGENVVIKNSTIGPHVSIGNNTLIENSIISKSIIQSETKIINTNLYNSMIGNKVFFNGGDIQQEVSLGDFSQIK